MPHTRVRLKAFGGAENLELETVADLPEPGAGAVRVRVLVTSAAFTDVMIRKGMDPDVKDKPPFTLGYDMVGIVDATGPGATRFQPGDRVADLPTYICLPEDRLTRVPDGVSEVDALAEGRITPVVAEVLPLANVREAHERVEAGDVKGKLDLPPKNRAM